MLDHSSTSCLHLSSEYDVLTYMQTVLTGCLLAELTGRFYWTILQTLDFLTYAEIPNDHWLWLYLPVQMMILT